MNLAFLNSNWFRSYPIQSGCDFTSLNGEVLPKDILVGTKITTDQTFQNVYISKVIINNGLIGLEFCSNNQVMGTVTCKPTYSNQTFSIRPVYSCFSGFVIIGNLDKLNDQHSYIFPANSLNLEPSTVIPFLPPTIKSISCKNISATGNITIVSNTLTIVPSSNDIIITTIAPSSVASKQDKTAVGLTCINPVINGINTVTPDKDGNIDIYGIDPVRLQSSAGQLVIASPTLPLTSTCKKQNIPPENNSNVYQGDIITVTEPEWKTWPQYQ